MGCPEFRLKVSSSKYLAVTCWDVLRYRDLVGRAAQGSPSLGELQQVKKYCSCIHSAATGIFVVRNFFVMKLLPKLRRSLLWTGCFVM
jgi:hypothetical protein